VLFAESSDTWGTATTSSSSCAPEPALPSAGTVSYPNIFPRVRKDGRGCFAHGRGSAMMKMYQNLRWSVEEESDGPMLIPCKEEAQVEIGSQEKTCSDEHRFTAEVLQEKENHHYSDNLYRQILELYDKFRPRLLRYIQSMYLSREQAEDVIQETFARLAKEFSHKIVIDNVQGWIVRVAHNLSVDIIKNKERESSHFCALSAIDLEICADLSMSPEEEYLKKEQIQQLEGALLGLNPRQRQCFQMRAQGFRYKDIAGALGVSEQRAALIVRQVSVRLAAICG